MLIYKVILLFPKGGGRSWMGFCLAMVRLKKIPVTEFSLDAYIDTITKNLDHLQQPALEFVKPYVFEWNL